MFSTINWVAAAVAAFATFVIGGPWYAPPVFGKLWQREMGVSADSPRGHPARVFGLAYLFSLVSTACLSALLGPGAGAIDGLVTGAVLGFCFATASFGVNYQFANRSLLALAIDGGYHTVQFAAFGLILGAWPG